MKSPTTELLQRTMRWWFSAQNFENLALIGVRNVDAAKKILPKSTVCSICSSFQEMLKLENKKPDIFFVVTW